MLDTSAMRKERAGSAAVGSPLPHLGWSVQTSTRCFRAIWNLLGSQGRHVLFAFKLLGLNT